MSKGGQQISPQLMQTIPTEFLPFARQQVQYLSQRLGQTNPYTGDLLQRFFGYAPPNLPTQLPTPAVGQAPVAPDATQQPFIGIRQREEGTVPDFMTPPKPGAAAPQAQIPQAPAAAPQPMMGGGFLGQGQDFLGGLLSGQIPESLRGAFARNLQESQGLLNSQLQRQGAFYSTSAQEQQRRLSEDALNNLNNLVFQNAMGAIPQGLQLFGTAGGMAGLQDQLSPALGASTNLLAALQGQAYQPQYAPDPLMQILTGILPFITF